MREFTTAVEAVLEEEQGLQPGDVEFTVRRTFPDDREDEVRVIVAHRPGDGQVGYVMAQTGRHSSMRDQVAGILNFFESCLDDEDAAYISDRLLNPKDEFGLENVRDIMEYLMEEWTGRPTQSPSGSTPSRRTGGQKSTRRTPALTS